MAEKRTSVEEREPAQTQADREAGALNRAAGLAIRFLLGAILSGGELFNGGAPFAVGLVAASGAGLGGLCALVGAVGGYLVFQGVTPGLRFAAAAVLVFSVAFAFYDVKLYRKSWFMPLMAAVMDAATGFVYLSESRWAAAQVAFLVTESLLCGVSVVLYRTALSLRRTGEGETLTPKELVSVIFLPGTLLMPLLEIDLLGKVIFSMVILTAGVFLLLPGRVLKRVKAALGKREDRSAKRAAQYAGEKLAGTAKAFRRVRDSLRSAFPATAVNDGDPAKIFDRAAGRVCAGCALRDTCWEKDYVNTFNALNDALPTIMDKGKGEATDFPGWFAARCVHFGDFLRAANEEAVALRYRLQYQNRLRESRGAVCKQYDTLSEILSSVAAELSAELTPDPLREKKLRHRMSELGVDGETAVYYDANGRLRLELEGEELDKLSTAQELRRLSDLMGLPLRRVEDVPGRMTLTQAEPLMAVAGVAARRREGQRESGDTGTWFKRGDGSLFVLLCDGMGSGELAHRESALAVRLLEEFLRTGMESAAALRTVNAALALRNEESGAFTTVDLLRVDLYTGEGEVCKLGAAPTYLRREGEVKRLTGCALPAGLTDGSPDVTALSLAPGDCVLLVSDGVADQEDDQWLRDLLTAHGEDSPKELARQVMEESEKRVGAADDRTAVAIQIKTR